MSFSAMNSQQDRFRSSDTVDTNSWSSWSEHEKPVWPSGREKLDWTLNSESHRYDGSSLARGYVQTWRLYGFVHRLDGPASIESGRGVHWSVAGKNHNDDGPAIVTTVSKLWAQRDKCHREDGPAFISIDGTKEWWLNGEKHREDGPAVLRPDGAEEWWLHGKRQGGPLK